MTEIPIDPVLRAAVLAELAKAHLTAEDLADGIIRAINRTLYLNAVSKQAQVYAQMSKEAPDRKSAPTRVFVDEYMSDKCCCVAGEANRSEQPMYPCRKCPRHSDQTKSRLMCFNHRKLERGKG